MTQAIILFDGVCNLCNASVQFIIDRDRAGQFMFASLQSDVGRELLATHGLIDHDLDSIVLIQDKGVYMRSTAALHVARQLDYAWPLLYAGMITPRPIRDAVYGWIARNRYRWFGEKDSCPMPTPALRSRFLSS